MTPDEQEAAEQAAWDAKLAAVPWSGPRRRKRPKYTPAPRRKRRELGTPPLSGAADYSAYIAELSAELGSLDAAFEAAMGRR